MLQESLLRSILINIIFYFKAIDMDNDNQVDWNEFMVYVKWALNQYPDIVDVDELLGITFKKGGLILEDILISIISLIIFSK